MYEGRRYFMLINCLHDIKDNCVMLGVDITHMLGCRLQTRKTDSSLWLGKRQQCDKPTFYQATDTVWRTSLSLWNCQAIGPAEVTWNKKHCLKGFI